MKAHGRRGILGALALVYAIVMQNGIEQEASQEVICHALAMQPRKEAVQVILFILYQVYDIIFKISMQLKVHGQFGILGTPALVHVILMQEGIEQGTLMEATCLAWEVKHNTTQFAQVSQRIFSKNNLIL